MCITNRYDMTLAVKVVLNPNPTNQLTWNVKDTGTALQKSSMSEIVNLMTSKAKIFLNHTISS